MQCGTRLCDDVIVIDRVAHHRDVYVD